MEQPLRPTFSWVTKSNSFAGAAVVLGMPKATVSQQVRALEARVGTRLLDRTTRNLVLREVGRLFFAHSERAVAEADSPFPTRCLRTI